MEVDFEKAYKDNYVALVRFAESLVKRTEVAEDIVADVFVGLWYRQDILAQIEEIKHYLYRSVRNRAINYLERDKNNLKPIDMLNEGKWAIAATPESHLISKEILLQLNKIIGSLPPKCLMCFQLIKGDGCSYKEVSQIMGISIRTVNAQMVKAVKIILTELKKNNITIGIFIFLCVFS